MFEQLQDYRPQLRPLGSRERLEALPLDTSTQERTHAAFLKAVLSKDGISKTERRIAIRMGLAKFRFVPGRDRQRSRHCHRSPEPPATPMTSPSASTAKANSTRRGSR